MYSNNNLVLTKCKGSNNYLVKMLYYLEGKSVIREKIVYVIDIDNKIIEER